jgi:hypothetical protein
MVSEISRIGPGGESKGGTNYILNYMDFAAAIITSEAFSASM